MSLLHQWTMAELRKRLQVNLETGGNVSPNKIPLTTGVGTRAELKTIPIVGDWIYKSANFDMVQYNNYLVDTEAAIVTAILPLAPEDKVIFWLKDAKASFSIHSLFVNRHPLATYTINEIADDLEIDISTSDVFLMYDALNNNWIL